MSFDFEKYLPLMLDKVKRTAKTADGKFPGSGFKETGEYKAFPEGGWTDGFFPGMLYLSYEATGDKSFLNEARRYDESYDVKIKEKLYMMDHDIGFLFSLKDVFDYRLTESKYHKFRALKAAEKHLSRYSKKLKILPAWDVPHPFDPTADYGGRIICDTMMNMPLLMWAYTQTKNKEYEAAAVNHSLNAAKYLIREDGSSFHVFDFNTETGEPVRGKTLQGYSDDSCWARGQSWLIYGFALMYRYTKKEEFLKAAEKTADYFTAHLSAYKLPVWDFAVSGLEYRPWDASAGAIAVCGMLETARHEKDGGKAAFYRKSAEEIMMALTNFCSTYHTPELEPLIIHTCGAPVNRKGKENILVWQNPDSAIIFGDYFYLEALIRFKNPEAILGW